MKVNVDKDRCIGMGICESLAPDYFEVNDDGELELLRQDIDEADLPAVEAAVARCPTRTPSIER